MLVCIWRGGVNFGGEADCGPNNGMGLILVLGVMARNRFVDMATSFERSKPSPTAKTCPAQLMLSQMTLKQS